MKILGPLLSVLMAGASFGASRDIVTPGFQKHVVPLLGKLGCSSAKCHGSFQGQGGFRLSLFGFDLVIDSICGHMWLGLLGLAWFSMVWAWFSLVCAWLCLV